MRIKYIDWKICGICDLRCKHCYGPPKTERSLPLPQLLKLVEIFRELGASWVVLTGGEPLLVRGIDRVMERLADRGIRVGLSTNLSFFPQHQRAIEASISSLNIALDGSRPEIHALSRNDHSSFFRVFEVLEHYRRNPHVKPDKLRVGTVYSKANQNDFLAISERLSPFSAVVSTWKIYELLGSEMQPELRAPLTHDPLLFLPTMNALLARTPLAEKIVLAPAGSRDRAYFMVSPNGDLVVPTDMAGVTHDLRVGNLLEESPIEVAERWADRCNLPKYNTNHRAHYDKAWVLS